MRVIGHLFDRLHRDERGSVLVFFVGFLPVVVAVMAFVIDMGNGAEHRRHLQLQADAGALAAALEFNGCSLDENAANDASYSALSTKRSAGRTRSHERCTRTPFSVSLRQTAPRYPGRIRRSG